MDQHLTDIDAQIAAIEAEIADISASMAATADIPRNKSLRKEQRSRLSALSKQHAQLVARVQRWTVGASRGMEVL